MARLKAEATTTAPYDNAKLYKVTLNERVSLTEHKLTLYPGKEYTIRGDLLNELAAKVKTAKEA